MPKPYDSAAKALVDHAPEDWVRVFGLPVGETVSVVDTDLATVTAEADRVIRVEGCAPYLLHLEFQASYDASMATRLLRYNALLRHRYGLPVTSALVLLRPAADGAAATGVFEEPGLSFRYRLLRVWQRPPEFWLAAGKATLPLAPLGDVDRERLPAVIAAMGTRLAQELPADAAALWSAAYLLSGLRLGATEASQLFQGVRQMKESTTYQAILAEGAEQGRREGAEQGRREGAAQGAQIGRHDEALRLLLLLAARRFGAPPEDTLRRLEQAEVEALEAIAERLLTAQSWSELLG